MVQTAKMKRKMPRNEAICTGAEGTNKVNTDFSNAYAVGQT